MFLNSSFMRMTSAGEHRERGSAMVSVIGVMSVIAIISVTVLSSTLNAMGTTSSTRASVQARAAAEAGIDVATVGLQTTNSCMLAGGVYASAAGALPQYQAVIAYDEGTGWVDGCPTDDADLIRITATGNAHSVGVLGATAGDDVTLEAIYRYKPVTVRVPLAGSAVYAHEIKGVLKKFVIESPANSLATSVSIKIGDVDCTNGARIGGDLILEQGSALLNDCEITGKLHVSGNAVIEHKSKVGGDVKAGGFVTKSSDSTIGGTVTSGVSVSPPVVPDWVNVNGDPLFWEANGFEVKQWGGTTCEIGGSSLWKNTLESFTRPTVLDFRSVCPTSPLKVLSNSVTAKLKTNVVFVAEGFDFQKLYLQGANPGTTVTFIVPDLDMSDHEPTCGQTEGLRAAGVGDVNLESEFDLEGKDPAYRGNLAALIYTPCKITSKRDGFRGQMYGGEVEFLMQASLTFVPVTIPGVDFTNGETEEVQSGAEMGAYVSLREVG